MFWNKSAATNLPNFYATQLNGSRVILRPPHGKDCANWLAARERNKLYLQAYEPTWSAQSLTETFYHNRLSRQKTDWLGDLAYSFLVFGLDNKTVLGGININHVARGAAQHATLGYWLDEGLQGQGLMREALELAIMFCRDGLRLHRLHAATLPHNLRSHGLLLRLGFVEEGFAKAYVQINGSWADHRLYGLILSQAPLPDK